MYPYASRQTGSGSAFAQMMRRQKRMNSGGAANFPSLNRMNDSLLPPIVSQHPPVNPTTKTPSSSTGDTSYRELSEKTPPAELLRVIGELQRELNTRTDSVNAIQRNFERLSGMYRQDQAELARVTAELQGMKEASKDAVSSEKVLLAVQLELENIMEKYKKLQDDTERERQDYKAALSAPEIQQSTLREMCEGLSKEKASLSEQIETLELKYAQANANIADLEQKATLQTQEERQRQQSGVRALVRRVGTAIKECVDAIEASVSTVGFPRVPSNEGGNPTEAAGDVSKNADRIDAEVWEPWMETAAQDLLSSLKVISPTVQHVLSTTCKAVSELNFSLVVQSTIEPAEAGSRRQLEELEAHGRGVLQRLQQSAHGLLDTMPCTLAKAKVNLEEHERRSKERCDWLRSCAHEFALWSETVLHDVCDKHLDLLDSYVNSKGQVMLDIALAGQSYAKTQEQRACQMSIKVHEVEGRLAEAIRDYEKQIKTIQANHTCTLADRKQVESHLKAQHSLEMKQLREHLQQSLQQKEQLLNETKRDFEQTVQSLKAQLDRLQLTNSHTEEQRRMEWGRVIEIMNSETTARMVILDEENVRRLSEERAVGATLVELAVANYRRIHFSQQAAFGELMHAEEQKRCALYFEEYQDRLSVVQYFWRVQSRRLESTHKDDMAAVRRDEAARLLDIIQSRDRQHLCELDELLKQLEATRVAESELRAELTTLRGSLKTEQTANEKKQRAVISAVGCLLSAEEASESAYSCLSCLKLLRAPRTCVPCGHTFCSPCLLEHPRNKGEIAAGRENVGGRPRHGTSWFCPECKMRNVEGVVSTRALEELATKFTYKTKVLRDVLAYLGPGAAEAGSALEAPPNGNGVSLPS
ncbi:unnamed protein product [Phytomonas sp. EM1]|nr:unnamed protein product [Phytomonas sp. EM1]|eukprot:CCW63016.1 unnamed protein product [Phytomonas sp. isolate EM1]